jgi:protocatechuate 3,4-dioxygenase beta subunit
MAYRRVGVLGVWAKRGDCRQSVPLCFFFLRAVQSAEASAAQNSCGWEKGVVLCGRRCKAHREHASLCVGNTGPSAFSRRCFLRAVGIAAAPVTFLAQVKALFAQARDEIDLEPTPAVGDELKPTPEETSGPFFRPNSPLKRNFREAGLRGVPVRLSGLVSDSRGRPISGALLDFWHADTDGEYDLTGFNCRGHQFCDNGGRYVLETIVPGLYPGRTRHYHVRLQAAHGPILSTQLYFPGEARNATDSLFRPDLLLKIRATDTFRLATYHFVLKTA